MKLDENKQQFLRFVVVGVLNTIIGTSVMFLCYRWLSWGYWLSSAMNYTVGSVFSYFANKYITFRSREKSVSEVVRFVLNISVCYLLAYGIAKRSVLYIGARLLRDRFAIDVMEQAAMLVGMGLFVILNFLGQKLLVFKNRSE